MVSGTGGLEKDIHDQGISLPMKPEENIRELFERTFNVSVPHRG